MNNNLRKFMDACENKQKRYVRKLAKEVDFNVREWFEIFQLSIFSFYRRVTAEEYVIKAPSTLRDLIYIAEECEKSGDKNLYKKASYIGI